MKKFIIIGGDSEKLENRLNEISLIFTFKIILSMPSGQLGHNFLILKIKNKL